MKFTDMDKGNLYIRPHWLVDGYSIPIHLLKYNHSRKEWVYVDPEKLIKDKKIKTTSAVGNSVRSAMDLIEFTENMEIKDIEEKNTKEKKMKTDKNYTGKAQIVVVHYINEIGEIPRKEIDGYAFKADLSLKLKDGDIVVVDDANGLNVCMVTKVLSDGTDIAYHAKMARLANAWIVNKVNDKPHIKRIKATEELKKIDIELEELKKAAIKKKELEEELKLLSEITGSKELLKRREKLLNE